MEPKAQEFVRRIAAAGWSQADAARRLGITAGAVSQICSGKTSPHTSTLNLLDLILEHEQRAARKGRARRGSALAPAWEIEVVSQLRALPAEAREKALPLIRQVIKAFRQGTGI